ncbi:MAG TPA: hypothetical protein VKT28_17860 [Puia sp.]|nr:hypothetical protein [Puia sp.]
MKRKKLHYVPGFISLLGLPIVLYFLGPEDVIDKTCLKLFLASDKKPPKGIRTLSRYTLNEDIKKKKLISIYINNSDDKNDFFPMDRMLSFIQSEIERLQFTHDTSSVLKIEFGNGSSYGQFVWLLNQTMLYEVKRFVVVDNTVYLFTNPPPIE